MSSIWDKMLEHDIDKLNDHLPHARVNFSDLLQKEDPHFITRSGEKSVFKVEELEWLSKEVPKQFHDSIRLPIVLLRRLDYGPGIHTVAGNKTELFVIHKVLGYDDLAWDNFSSWKPIEQLTRPQIQILRRKMSSSTSLGIVLATLRDNKKNDL
ncbi:MAG: DUF61 family protein [Candidatus Thorarchaeota archaeon]